MEDAGNKKTGRYADPAGEDCSKKKRQNDQGSMRTLHTPRFLIGHQSVYQPNLQDDYT
jgi:hypothetical protein